MKMSDDQEKVLDWAVKTLRDASDPALPDGFLSRFEEKLQAESDTPPLPRIASSATTVTSSSDSRWYRVLAVAVAMIAVLGLLLFSPPQKPDPRSGLLVVAATNQVQVQQAEVKQVQELSVGQTLNTGADGGVVLMAETLGNEVRVAPDSRLRLVRGSRGNRVAELSLDRGSVLIRESQTQIAVRTAHVLITPIGTEYEVRCSDRGTEVTVFDGEVRVSELGGQSSVLVGKAQKVLVDASTSWKGLRPSSFTPDKSARPQLYGTDLNLDRTPRAGEKLKPYPEKSSVEKPGTNRPVGTKPNLGSTSTYPKARPTPARKRPTHPRAQATPGRVQGPIRRPVESAQPGDRPGPSRPGPSTVRQTQTSVDRPYPTAPRRYPGTNDRPGQTSPQPRRSPRPGDRTGAGKPRSDEHRPRYPRNRQWPPGQRPQQSPERRPAMRQPSSAPGSGINQPHRRPRPGVNRPAFRRPMHTGPEGRPSQGIRPAAQPAGQPFRNAPVQPAASGGPSRGR